MRYCEMVWPITGAQCYADKMDVVNDCAGSQKRRFSYRPQVFSVIPGEAHLTAELVQGHEVPREDRKVEDRGVIRALPALLHDWSGVFWRAMSPQQLRKVLRKRGPGQHHVAPHLVRLLLEIALHVREEPDN